MRDDLRDLLRRQLQRLGDVRDVVGTVADEELDRRVVEQRLAPGGGGVIPAAIQRFQVINRNTLHKKIELYDAGAKSDDVATQTIRVTVDLHRVMHARRTAIMVLDRCAGEIRRSVGPKTMASASAMLKVTTMASRMTRRRVDFCQRFSSEPGMTSSRPTASGR